MKTLPRLPFSARNIRATPKIPIGFLFLLLFPPPSPTQEIPLDLTKGERNNLAFDDRQRLRLERTDKGFLPKGEFLSEPIDLKAENTQVRVDWLEQWTAPQKWKKHPGNPIYGPDKSGPWDTWTNGVSIVKTADGKTYRMFYAGRKGAGIGFAEASVDDPLTWKEHPNSPVLRPREDNWEGNMLNQPRVVKVTDTHWRMYYTGWGVKGPGTTWGMGLAESFDAGLTWKRYQDDMILHRGLPSSFDGGGACVPMVLPINPSPRADPLFPSPLAGEGRVRGWLMWYTAALVTPGKQNIHLCLATSPDGINWKRYDKNPVLTDDFSRGDKRVVISRCFVRHDDGVFRMWYSFAKPNYRICYAESLDGKDWEKSPIEPVLGPSPAKAWDDQMVEYPEVDIYKNTFRLWFCGNGFGSVGYAEGIPETSLTLSLRSRPDPKAPWSDWSPLTRRQPLPTARQLQIRAILHSENPSLSPALNQVSLHLSKK
jgi:predicted GH43/DUF377 family glycosyl hydrolase